MIKYHDSTMINEGNIPKCIIQAGASHEGSPKMEKSHTSAIELAVLRLFTTASCNKAAGTPPWDFLWRGIHTANSHHLQIQKHIIKTGWWFGTFLNIFHFSIQLGSSSSQLTNTIIFQRGRSTTSQNRWLRTLTHQNGFTHNYTMAIDLKPHPVLDDLDFGCGLPLILPCFFLKKPWEMMINPWPPELRADSWLRQFPPKLMAPSYVSEEKPIKRQAGPKLFQLSALVKLWFGIYHLVI